MDFLYDIQSPLYSNSTEETGNLKWAMEYLEAVKNTRRVLGVFHPTFPAADPLFCSLRQVLHMVWICVQICGKSLLISSILT